MEKVKLLIALWHGMARPLSRSSVKKEDFELAATMKALAEAEPWLQRHPESVNILRIFVGPEGMLVNTDTEADIPGLKRQLEAASKNILLIPGTAIFRKQAFHPKKDVNQRTKIGSKLKMYNERRKAFTHLSQPKVEETTGNLRGEMFEEAISQKLAELDALQSSGETAYIGRNAAYAYHGGHRLLKYYKQNEYMLGPASAEFSLGNNVKFIPGYKEGFFEVELAPMVRILCGLEVCADHDDGQLKYSSGHRDGVDLHFLLSDYVVSRPEKVAARAGGYLIHASTVSERFGKSELEAVSGVFQVEESPRVLTEINRTHHKIMKSGALSFYEADLEVTPLSPPAAPVSVSTST